jgi:hypothetical protein
MMTTWPRGQVRDDRVSAGFETIVLIIQSWITEAVSSAPSPDEPTGRANAPRWLIRAMLAFSDCP